MPSELERFNERMQAFFAPLWPGEEKPLVLGEGCSERPPVMLIGEAPGEQEAMSGRPFVGKAGKNLDGFLTVLQLNREDIYISNVVKIRPTKVSEKGRVSNRTPNREELALFTPYLLRKSCSCSRKCSSRWGIPRFTRCWARKAPSGRVTGRC